MDSELRRPDWLGGVVGILTFLVGVGLLLVTFQQAYGMFSVEPAQALGIRPGDKVDIGRTGENFVGIVGRVLFLLVMSAVGSVIANRGVKLYAESRVAHTPPPAKGAKEASPARSTAEHQA